MGAILVASVIFILAFSPFTLYCQPRIDAVDGTTVDFGSVGIRSLSDTVRIINRGNDTLRIKDVVPTCGCTTASLDKYRLAPGDTGVLPVTFNTRNRRGEAHSDVVIFSNDSLNSPFVITLRATIIRDVAVEPEYFPTIERALVSGTYTSSVSFVNRSGQVVFIQAVPAAGTDADVRLDAETRRAVQPGDTVKITATVVPRKPGMLRTHVDIRTSSDYVPEIRVPLDCVVIRKSDG